MGKLLKECLKRANRYYQNPNYTNLCSLQMIYHDLSDEEREIADVEIKKLLPSWES